MNIQYLDDLWIYWVPVITAAHDFNEASVYGGDKDSN